MKEFFKTALSSVWDPGYYETMASRGIKEAIRYFLSLILLVSFAMIVMLSISLVPKALQGVTAISDLAAAKYPKDLVVSFNNGLASTSEARAYVMPLPPELFDQNELNRLRQAGIENLAVVDTRTDFLSVGQWIAARAFILLTRDAVVSSSNSGGYEVRPLPFDLKATITKDVIISWAAKIVPLMRIVIPVAIVAGFIILFISYSITYFVYCLIGGLIIWAVAALMKRKGRYGDFLAASMHAVTLAVILDFIFFIFGVPLGAVLSRDLLIIIVVWMLNTRIWQKPNLPVAPAPDSPPEVKS